jgi:hypothetical protein
MQKDYRFLAERLVQLGEQKRTVEELEAMLRRRVQPCLPPAPLHGRGDARADARERP